MRSRRRHDDDLNLVGQDSFLDVVANLVGIFVILITVIGIGVRDAQVTAAATTDVNQDSRSVDPTQPQRLAENIEHDLAQVQNQIRQIESDVLARRRERDAMLTRMELVQQAIHREQFGLNADEQKRLELLKEAESLRDRLTDLSAREAALQQEKPTTEELKHDATPIAETVYGVEQHFRLSAGRLDYVPLNELVMRLKEDAERNAWRLKDSPALTETLGPVDGYYMQYTLTIEEQPILTAQGPGMQRMVALDEFILVPADSQIGRPIAEMMRDDSDLANRLRGIDPGTTITIWTYPDSFAEFRALREWLAQRGFRAAARPLPVGQPIAGSPRGTRSAAQ